MGPKPLPARDGYEERDRIGGIKPSSGGEAVNRSSFDDLLDWAVRVTGFKAVAADPTALPSRNVIIAFAAALVGLSVYSLAFFLWHKIYLIGSDAYYYMSIADSFVATGSFLDQSSFPTQPLKSPQNGIVSVHVLLSWLGFGPEGRLASISIISYVLHVSATYPLYKIARRVGLKATIPMAALIAVYLGAFHVYRLQLIAYNDGVFNALSIWLTYVLLVGLQEIRAGSFSGLLRVLTRHRVVVPLMVVLAVVLVHFRINSIGILGSALLATVAVWRLRNAVWIGALLAVSFVSITLPYVITDSSRMSDQSGRVTADILSRLPGNVFDIATISVPNLIFAPVSERASIVYFPFALVLLVALIVGLRGREPGILFVGLSCAAAFLYVAILPSQTSRYLVYIFPLMFLLLLRWRPLRPIGYMFAGLVIASSFVTFATGHDRGNESKLWLHLYEGDISLPAEDPLLVTDRNRHPYFFLDTRTYRGDLSWELVTSRGQLFVLGDEEYIATRIDELDGLAAEHNATYSRETLTPGYSDEDGHALIRLYDFRTGM